MDRHPFGYGIAVADEQTDDDTQPFHQLTRDLDAPCFVVTAAADERTGCLVGFSTQCSIDPVRYLVCLSRTNHTARVAGGAGAFAVHVLRPDDEELAHLFGEETGDEVDKFTRCAWTPGPGGTPIVDGLDWFYGTVRDRLDLGDHIGLLLDVVPGVGLAERAGEPRLGYAALAGLEAGHAP